MRNRLEVNPKNLQEKAMLRNRGYWRERGWAESVFPVAHFDVSMDKFPGNEGDSLKLSQGAFIH